jgi:centromere protein C
MFSSPEKSPVRENGAGDYGNESAMSSDGMSMDEGTLISSKHRLCLTLKSQLAGNGPGPVDFLNGINGGRPSLFPPPAPSVSRSPMKTGLTGSPRRTPGLRSSSPQHHPSSATSSADRGMGGRRPGSGQDSSPLSRRSMNTPASSHAQRPRSKVNGQEAAAAVEFSDSDGNSQLNGDENADTFEQAQDDFVDGTGAGDDSVAGSDHASPDAEMNGQNGLDDDSPPADTRRTEQAKPASKKKGTALDKGKGRDTSIRNETEQPTQKGKGRGRPPKAARTADAEGDQRPSKKAKTTDHRTQNEDEPLDPEVDKVVEDYANRTGPLKGRSLHILKREAPNHTRSGRVSIRPLAYWRNERCVYGDSGADEGARYPTTTVKEVIRTEDIEPEKKRAGKRSSKKSKSKKNADKESDDEGDDYIDPWEKEGGVLHGYIRKWDPETQTGTEEDEVLGESFYFHIVG